MPAVVLITAVGGLTCGALAGGRHSKCGFHGVQP